MADVKVKIGVDGSGLKTGLQQAKGDVDRFASEASGALSKFGASLAGVFSVGAIVGWAKSIGDTVSTIQDTADRLDITAESVQGLSDYFGESGARAQDFDKAMVKLNQSLDDARGGNEKALGSFEKLGITWEDIATKSPDEILLLIADGMKNANNPTEALASAMDVLGKSGARLVPGLKAGADEIERFVAVSAKFTNEEVQKIDQAFDDMARGAKKASVEVAQLIMQMTTLKGMKDFGDAALSLIGIDRKIKTGPINEPEAQAIKAGNDARRRAGPDAAAAAEDPRAVKAREEQAKEAERLQKEITATQDKEAKARLEEERKCLLEQMENERKSAEERRKIQEKLTEEKAKLADAEAEAAADAAEKKAKAEKDAADKAAEEREGKIDEKLKTADQRREERREASKRARAGRAMDKAAEEAEKTAKKNAPQLQGDRIKKDAAPADKKSDVATGNKHLEDIKQTIKNLEQKLAVA